MSQDKKEKPARKYLLTCGEPIPDPYPSRSRWLQEFAIPDFTKLPPHFWGNIRKAEKKSDD